MGFLFKQDNETKNFMKTQLSMKCHSYLYSGKKRKEGKGEKRRGGGRKDSFKKVCTI